MKQRGGQDQGSLRDVKHVGLTGGNVVLWYLKRGWTWASVLTWWVALILESVDEVIVNTQMKATEQYFPVVLFIMLYKLALTFESVDKILKCDHSNESY